TVAAHVVHTRNIVNVGDVLQEDTKFPAGIGKRGPKTQAVLAVPVLLDNEQCAGVIEICRDFGKPQFTQHDEQLLRNYSKWGELVVRYAKLYEAVKHQTDFNDLLLNVTKSLYTDIVQGKTADDLSVIDQILEQAKDLINAERCSLFLIDKETDELYAKAFDIGAGSDESKSSTIRTPSKKGVIGDTFQTGNVNRIEDVDSDERFNKEIDKLTGFKTRNLLCIPIHSDKGIIGVTEMVNKKLERGFSLSDERAFYTLTVFCGLALYTNNLERRLARMLTAREINMSVLNYYRVCSQDECDVITALPPMQVSSFQLSRYDFDTWSCSQETQVRLFIGLFEDLFPGLYDRDLLIRFTLTVKKNYRKVAYHNWEHAFCVANCMYSILKSNQVMCFTTNEMLALFVGCICHDLDHRGYTNSFMKLTAHPLSAIYSSSIMENHHYEQTLQLLMQKDLNVFANLKPDDYVNVIAIMKHAIIATDLALYFDNRTTLRELHNKNLFNSDDREHKQRLRALIMTCCDLCAVTKPWNVQKIVVEHINEEFHNQGDQEKALGFEPLPLMDRAKAETQTAQSQVDFITSVCLPAYKLLSELMPSTSPMYEGALSNLKKWETVAKHGPEAVEIPTNNVENQEVTKPAAKLRRTKTNGNKKGKNVGKDRFPTHKVKR
ncbi:cAMP and cAMP-inhibited cGMP 3',5'-cyclic phosphodiesterase 10A-like, partial [Bolinopsis microptera]|uniref:cAMP and cAMP-inhibited cGMP 3',5'-cyclic phosphodiesterase 10A-like n=1 Tax=Bolinopsis microptera TaxID=2820187 RepID=UPI003079B3BC